MENLRSDLESLEEAKKVLRKANLSMRDELAAEREKFAAHLAQCENVRSAWEEKGGREGRRRKRCERKGMEANEGKGGKGREGKGKRRGEKGMEEKEREGNGREVKRRTKKQKRADLE